MVRPDAPEGRSTVFLSGDSGAAERLTDQSLTGLGRSAASRPDLGGIGTARGQEHFALLFIGIAEGLGSHVFNIDVVTLPSGP
ncbi:hypothetical protein AB0H18_03360 [Streptomyces sp. NPDC020766]|uniref:hypothetical protein n=1 Tax=Streptomyces sp. NPDC020766 TaxID=3155011 RepID=UPI0033C3DA44